MDWTSEFQIRFKDYKELQTLKADKFHGSLEIHFNAGTVVLPPGPQNGPSYQGAPHGHLLD